MRISGRKFAITGASRGLGAALAHVMAAHDTKLVLLARSEQALAHTADEIQQHTGQSADTLICDLADAASATAAGQELAHSHPDLDGIIHNGAMYLSDTMMDTSDEDILACISSATIGALILTRHLLPVLTSRPDADIHTVVSTAGLSNRQETGTSVVFRASKSAQAGFVQGLTDELVQTRVRVSAVFPGDFTDVMPFHQGWNTPRLPNEPLTNREVIDAILFTLNLPVNAAVPALIIE
jgi:short-subunit dehydrogenase